MTSLRIKREPDLFHARASHSSTLMQDGRVLVTGGTGSEWGAIRSCEIFDPTLCKWQFTAPLITARVEHTATLLPSGHIMVTGGTDDACFAELYDPVKQNWSNVSAGLPPRKDHTALSLPDGRVVVIGGAGKDGTVLGLVDVYDPASNRWSKFENSPAPTYSHSSTLLPDGRILVAGGFKLDGLSVFSNEVYLLDPAVGRWSIGASLACSRRRANALTLVSGKVIVVGEAFGSRAYNPPQAAEIYDPTANVWSWSAEITKLHMDGSATVLPSGQVLVVGGWGDESSLIELYDEELNTWAVQLPLCQGRARHCATLLHDGSVLVAGGSVGASIGHVERIYS